MRKAVLVACVVWTAVCAKGGTMERSVFARDNLVAWCIVPFDAKKRGPK